jgi:hypothetical protein
VVEHPTNISAPLSNGKTVRIEVTQGQAAWHDPGFGGLRSKEQIILKHGQYPQRRNGIGNGKVDCVWDCQNTSTDSNMSMT